jgi:hypothetical protein
MVPFIHGRLEAVIDEGSGRIGRNAETCFRAHISRIEGLTVVRRRRMHHSAFIGPSYRRAGPDR